MHALRLVGAPPRALRDLVARVLPGAEILEVEPLRPDSGDAAARKAIGYGAPVRIAVRTAKGERESLVLHFEAPNDFGHDRRSDRAANTLLAWDTVRTIPGHARALDVGVLTADGRLSSLADAGELWLLTSFVEGTLYAQDLRAIGRRGHASPLDGARTDALARYLVELHGAPGTRPPAYVRAIRDLVGHGEGIFGIVDGYPPDTPAAPPERLRAIEERCVQWRWKFKARTERLRRTHGDFHPFNVVFDAGAGLTVLDASRGGQGDPADDVCCMALNYPFFALQAPGAWARGFGPLWRRFWRGYLEGTRDEGVLDVAAPFLAWRALVMASPRWYPDLDPGARDALLGFVEAALEVARFDPESAERLFR